MTNHIYSSTSIIDPRVVHEQIRPYTQIFNNNVNVDYYERPVTESIKESLLCQTGDTKLGTDINVESHTFVPLCGDSNVIPQPTKIIRMTSDDNPSSKLPTVQFESMPQSGSATQSGSIPPSTGNVNDWNFASTSQVNNFSKPSNYFEIKSKTTTEIKQDLKHIQKDFKNIEKNISQANDKPIDLSVASPIINAFIGVAMKLFADVFGISGDFDDTHSNLLLQIKIEFCNLIHMIEKIQNKLKIIDNKLDKLATNLKFYSIFISQQITYLINHSKQQFFTLNLKLDTISNSLSNLERLVGEGFKEIQWREIYLMIDDYKNYKIRYGTYLPQKKIYKFLQIIENTILHPPMIEWISMTYFHKVKHTKEIDDTYFENKDYIGWLINKPIIPTEILNELFKTYHFLKFEVEGNTYDSQGIIYQQLIDKVKSYETIIPKEQIKNKITETKKLISDKQKINKEIIMDFDDEINNNYEIIRRQKIENVAFIADEKLGTFVFANGKSSDANSLIEQSKQEFFKHKKLFFYTRGDSQYHMWNRAIWCDNFFQDNFITSKFNNFISAEKHNLGTLTIEYYVEFKDTMCVMSDWFNIFMIQTEFHCYDCYQSTFKFEAYLKFYWNTATEKKYLGKVNLLAKETKSFVERDSYFYMCHTRGDANASMAFSPYMISYYVTEAIKLSSVGLFNNDGGEYSSLSVSLKSKIDRMKKNSSKLKSTRILDETNDFECQIRKNMRFLKGVGVTDLNNPNIQPFIYSVNVIAFTK